MEESQNILEPEPGATTIQLYQPRVSMVLGTQMGLFILGAGVGALVFQVLCLVLGWDPNVSLAADAPEMDRWLVRIQLGLGHLFAFCLSGWLTVWLFYRSLTGILPDWPDYLKIRRWPGWRLAGLAVLLMLVAMPLVLFALNLNKMIPLPALFKSLEDQTAETIKGLLQMPYFGEFMANLTIIAILPALGEELVFRGVVQQQLMRRISNPWVAILVSAFIFSAAHFQFEGFLPRMMLGVLLGWLYWQTQNFWAPVIAHFFNNGIQVAGQYLYGNKISTVDLEKDITVPWGFALLSAIMVWAVVRLIQRHTLIHSMSADQENGP
jgi:membrane protease YdiL (CAAX protease family)